MFRMIFMVLEFGKSIHTHPNVWSDGVDLHGRWYRRQWDDTVSPHITFHSQVFTIFLDTLMELIKVHYSDLSDWLYILLTRLLNKLGSDLLGSVQAKIHKTLDLVRSVTKD